jgi:opacity protein-like surface antigen
MKYRVLCLAILFAVATSAQAQPVAFGIHGNLVNFNFAGDFKEVYSLGYGGGAHLDFHLPILTLRLSGDYITISPDKEKYKSLLAQYVGAAIASGVTVDGLRINVISGNVNLKLPVLPLPVISVYATGGAGVVRLSATDATVTLNGAPLTTVKAPDAQTKASLNAGAGVDINLGGSMTLFGEVKVNWILTEGQTSTMVPLATVGLTF